MRVTNWQQVLSVTVYLVIIIAGATSQNLFVLGWGCGLLYGLVVFPGVQ